MDAIITARVPPPFIRREDWIARLFPNFKEVEIEYFHKTGIFPIMHTVVLREDFYRQHPWASQSLNKAFHQAKDQNFERLINLGAPPVLLPWFFHEMDQTIAIMGKNFWPYGLKDNKKVIEKLIEYMREQGLLAQDYRPQIQDLFAPNTLL